MAPPGPKPKGRQVDAFKKLPVFRSVEAVAAADEEFTGIVPRPDQVKKKDIPAPKSSTVVTYEQERTADYKPPVGYIRHPKKTFEEDFSFVDYCLTAEDEAWHMQHSQYGDKLPLETFEKMIDFLERVTGSQPHLMGKTQFENICTTRLGMNHADHHAIWSDVYSYWKHRRDKLGKPLLRRFWPPTPVNDTDPHRVFRARLEKEKYKLRRSRLSEKDSYDKMRQLKYDCEKALSILNLIKMRERMKQAALLVQQELFEQTLYDLTDTSGRPRPMRIILGEFKTKFSDTSRAVTEPGDENKDISLSFELEDKKKKKDKKKSGARKDKDEGANIRIPKLPSFMDPFYLRTEVCEPTDVVEPSLTEYTGTSTDCEPVLKYRCRGRIGRGGRVIFDRVPVHLEKNYEKKPTKAPIMPPVYPLIITSSEACRPHSLPQLQHIQMPYEPLQVKEWKIKEIYNMADDQEDLFEPEYMGYAANLDLPKQATDPIIRYTIQV